MPSDNLTLPTCEQVRFFYLRDSSDLGDMLYLQSIRSERITEDSHIAKKYRAMTWRYAIDLEYLLNGLNFDAIVSPPSTRPDVDVYIEKLRERNILDIRDRFSRRGITMAATADSLQKVIDEFEYAPSGDESQVKSLLIVDDLVASGNTVAAVLYHLRKAGLPDDCEITVAAPVWLKQDG